MNEHLKNEADRLLRDMTLTMALDQMRLEALEALASVKAENITEVLRLQANVAAIDQFRSALRTMVTRGSKAISPVGAVA